MPRKKFNRDEADKIWNKYTKELVTTITETEKEGMERGYSSYQIEKLFQERLEENKKKKIPSEEEETT